MNALTRELRRELRKAGVPTFREIRGKSYKVGYVHSYRTKSSVSHVAGIDLYEYADKSGYAIKYEKGWKNSSTQIHTAEEIAKFIEITVAILNNYNIARVDVKVGA